MRLRDPTQVSGLFEMVRSYSPGQSHPRTPIPLQPGPWLPAHSAASAAYLPWQIVFLLSPVTVISATCPFQCPSYLFRGELYPQAPFSHLFWNYANVKTRLVWLAVQQCTANGSAPLWRLRRAAGGRAHPPLSPWRKPSSRWRTRLTNTTATVEVGNQGF